MMSEAALDAEVARLRDEVAGLKAARAPEMEGFRQLNDAIVENRLGSFLAEKAQPRWMRNLVLALIVTLPLIVLSLIQFG